MEKFSFLAPRGTVLDLDPQLLNLVVDALCCKFTAAVRNLVRPY